MDFRTGADLHMPCLTQISEIGVWGSGLARKIGAKILWASPAGRFSKKGIVESDNRRDTAGPSYSKASDLSSQFIITSNLTLTLKWITCQTYSTFYILITP